jgi:hypothetical protein
MSTLEKMMLYGWMGYVAALLTIIMLDVATLVTQ